MSHPENDHDIEHLDAYKLGQARWVIQHLLNHAIAGTPVSHPERATIAKVFPNITDGDEPFTADQLEAWVEA